jgi:SAM-dependent methyltransferase
MSSTQFHSSFELQDVYEENGVLKTRDQLFDALVKVRELGLPLCEDLPKNWDSLIALRCVLRRIPKTGIVLDAGAEMYSVILPWLGFFGYQNLIGINISFQARTERDSVVYEPGNITNTTFPNGTFDAITCLSVIEHGVDIAQYLEEAFRILKPGGVLITSTDYYKTPIDTRGQCAFGVPIHIFTADEIVGIVERARRVGFELTSPLDLTSDQKVVTWDEYGLKYSFIVLTLKK